MGKTEITLSSGIVIYDNRYLGLGVSIKNQRSKYITLCYLPSKGFFLNMKGFYLYQDNLQSYLDELEIMKEAMIEANNVFEK